METNTSTSDPPSPLRIPLTLLLALTAPPLALAAWVLLSGSARAEYLRSRWVRAAGWFVAVGAMPLLAVIAAAKIGLLADPNPNPIGPGLFFFAAGLLGCLCALIGVLGIALGSPGKLR